MGQFSLKYFLILGIIDMSLAASQFRADKYTVTFDDDLDSGDEQQSESDTNSVLWNSDSAVPESTMDIDIGNVVVAIAVDILSKIFGQGRLTPLKSHVNKNQLFKVIPPLNDESPPSPRGKLYLNPQWVRGSDGEMGTFVYHAGYLHKDNFVARAVYNNSLIPGKIVSGQKKAYIGVGTKEIGYSSYETLCSSPSNLCWILPANLSTAEPVEGGHDENGNPIHVGRTSDQEILGAFYPSRGELVTTSNGHTNVDRNLTNIEILVWSYSVFPNCWW